jgi:hypothetical protein
MRKAPPPPPRPTVINGAVRLHYVNPHLGVQCDIEIPVNEKTKKAQLGNGMGLGWLGQGVTIKSDWQPQKGNG